MPDKIKNSPIAINQSPAFPSYNAEEIGEEMQKNANKFPQDIQTDYAKKKEVLAEIEGVQTLAELQSILETLSARDKTLVNVIKSINKEILEVGKLNKEEEIELKEIIKESNKTKEIEEEKILNDKFKKFKNKTKSLILGTPAIKWIEGNRERGLEAKTVEEINKTPKINFTAKKVDANLKSKNDVIKELNSENQDLNKFEERAKFYITKELLRSEAEANIKKNNQDLSKKKIKKEAENLIENHFSNLASKEFDSNDIVSFLKNQNSILTNEALQEEVKKAYNGRFWADDETPNKEKIQTRGSYGIYSPKNEDSDLNSGNIKFNDNNFPINPFLVNEEGEQIKTTGVIGRGNLGKWGANHAADSALFRIVKLEDGTFEIQQLIITRPTKELAMPGGMIDRGEQPLEAALRELGEEAMDLKTELLNNLLSSSFYIGAGANGDARSTDNAWMETAVYGAILQEKDNNVKVEAKDDAVGARWMKLTPELYEKMTFASHGDMLKSGWNKISEKLTEEVKKRANSNEINPQNPLEQIEKMDNLLKPSKETTLKAPKIQINSTNSSALNQKTPLPPIPVGRGNPNLFSLTKKDPIGHNKANVLSLHSNKTDLSLNGNKSVLHPIVSKLAINVEKPKLQSANLTTPSSNATNKGSTEGLKR